MCFVLCLCGCGCGVISDAFDFAVLFVLVVGLVRECCLLGWCCWFGVLLYFVVGVVFRVLWFWFGLCDVVCMLYLVFAAGRLVCLGLLLLRCIWFVVYCITLLCCVVVGFVGVC